MMNLPITSKRHIARFLIVVILAQLFAPYQSFALTGGPSQPEVQSFEPIGTSEMVDLATGNFTYNIPLLEVGGYPLNLAYHAGITPDDEASCVGLGWNINPGVINRNMRGLPDDFDGDDVTKEVNMKPNKTWGIQGGAGIGLELLGSALGLGIHATLGVNYDNYYGIGLEYGISPALSSSVKCHGKMTAGLGLTVNSQTGVDLSPSLGFSRNIDKIDTYDKDLGLTIGASINSRQGFKAMTFGLEYGRSEEGNWVGEKTTSEASFNSALSFAKPNYTPGQQLPLLNTSHSFSAKYGPSALGLFASFDLSGYFTKQELTSNSQTSNAYGVLYAQNGAGKQNALMDFNREKDVAFTKQAPSLPVSIQTQDLYTVAGQGIGGNYQLLRNDIGVVYDRYSASFSKGESYGGELGAPPDFEAGFDMQSVNTTTSTGLWTASNDAFGMLDFQKQNATNTPDFEPAYFKVAGEKTVESSPAWLTEVGGTKAVRVPLVSAGGMEVRAEKKLIDKNGVNYVSSTAPLTKAVRAKRSQPISYLTAAEATHYGLQQSIPDYPLNNFSGNHQNIPRTSDFRKESHLSEITVARTDGALYIYGIPAYNTDQQEVTFAVNHNFSNPTTGLVTYVPGVDNSTSNGQGLDHYYSKETLDAYAHSFLLSAIVSPDYVDQTGDGPTADDYGSYTRFNYGRVSPNQLFQWRTPVDKDAANYNEGFKTNQQDDKGSYIYGEKEIWMLHSVESRTQIAEFHYSDREDGLGVLDENGGKNVSKKQKKLEKIILYSKPDRYGSGAPVPIKSVHFNYDYSLCAGVPNNATGGGKLTLRSLSFSYGDSKKGHLSPYQFTYGYNPPYNIKDYNRWGTFFPNNYSGLSNADFPYVRQGAANLANLNLYAEAWNLKTIVLPSGGVINVEYEPDDYAFVQHKRAMEMTDIEGWSSNAVNGGALPTLSQNLYDNTADVNEYLFFKLKEPILGLPAPIAKAYLNMDYLTDLNVGKYLYIKAKVNMVAGTGQSEYVPCWTTVEDYGVCTESGPGYDHGWIKVKIVEREYGGISGSLNTHPLTKAALQFMRLQLPELAYGQTNVNESSGWQQILNSLDQLQSSMSTWVNGFNDQMISSGMCKSIVDERAWVRLFSADKRKIAGGYRVKSIRISDDWNNMAGGNSQQVEYGQKFTYELEETRGGQVRKYSSGVAAYEPIIGGDENPWREPYFVHEKNLLAPDNDLLYEFPLGESLFPDPTIIYSKVRVESISDADIKRHATGWTEEEFYTAKDFPTLVDQTDLQTLPKKTKPLLRILKIKNEDYMNASQGFVVELNDMHGKPKRQSIFDAAGTKISGVEYHYKQKDGKLGNTALVADADGTVSEQTIGMEVNMVADARESKTETSGSGDQINGGGVFAGFIYAPWCLILPTWVSEKTRFRSISTTKVVQRYGLLEETVVFDNGSEVSTRNLLYDKETGTVISTRTANEFDDPVFSFNYPAYWRYEGMKPSYTNIGVKADATSISPGLCGMGTNIKYFSPGDELALLNTDKKAWVLSRNGNNIYIIDASGQAVTYSGPVKIIRSGRRNLLDASMGKITATDNPITTTGPDQAIDFQGKNILQAATVEYSDEWQTWCSRLEHVCNCQKNQTLINDFLALMNYLVAVPSDPFEAMGTPIPPGFWTSHSALFNYVKGECPNNEFYVFGSVSSNIFSLSFRDAQGPCGCRELEFELPPGVATSVSNWKPLNFVSMELVQPIDCAHPKYVVTVLAQTASGAPFTFDMTGLSHKCVPFIECNYFYQPDGCKPLPPVVVNPFREGIRGNWRPKKSWAYLTNRRQGVGVAAGKTNIRKDGAFAQFSEFWQYNDAADVWQEQPAGWTWASETTLIDPFGTERESVDPLTRHDAQQMGYAQSLVIAASQNSRLRDMAFEGFESINYDQGLINNLVFLGQTQPCLPSPHFALKNAPISSEQAHTGKYSLFLNEHDLIATYPTGIDCTPIAETEPYQLRPCDCLPYFSPSPGRYVFSIWVKENVPPHITHYASTQVKLEAGGQTYMFNPAGNIIDGWQRMSGEFVIPTGAPELKITLIGHVGAAWFDDLRIHPFDATFKSFVYDDRTLRLTHELDDNNYFTEYNYNQEGMLERVNKETERGVMMLRESRFGQQKN